MVFPSSTHTPIIKSNSVRKSVKITPNSALCKCLFGRPDPESNDISNLTKEVISKEQRRFKRKWNFDVEKLSPVVVVPSTKQVEAAPTTPKKSVEVESSSPVVVAPSLAQVAAQFKWEKLDNENIPYFYYKPAQGTFDRMRPLTCRNKSETVPCTPVKRRYQETEVYQERAKIRASAVKSFKLFEPGYRSPTARRLDFDDVPQSPKKRAVTKSSTAVTKIRPQQQQTQLRLPILMKENFVKLGCTTSPKSASTTPKRSVQNKKQQQQQDKKNEASPRSQKLITEMMFVRRVRTTPSKVSAIGGDKLASSPAPGAADTPSSSSSAIVEDKGDELTAAAATASTSSSAAPVTSNSNTPFGSPSIARRNQVSSSQ